ncbi:hypothetical protein EVAR_9405_1 [Eumeta japonica]|uniref:Uncharacterized protein n=1 Tax=Eumeta variegata TaxID=151549 RepID=A0A4C1UDV7_EUMVA|nr:hypothetical protein EVAR_9405_1 [Eumeta japonica]
MWTQRRCFKCGKTYIRESCTVREDELSCLHCLGRYIATSKFYQELNRQKRIKISMAEESISYSETSKEHPSIDKSHANAAAFSLSNHSAQKSQLSNSTSSNRKTIFLKPHHSALRPNKGYNKASHQEIIFSGFSSSPNGCALSTSSPVESNSQ